MRTDDQRRDIDGLRALAVAMVIPFHAGAAAFKGGFVGVDVFFVISGYLMAQMVMSDLAVNSFSLARFYERRARRILPALLAVMLACLPLAWLWMTPDDLKRFCKSLVATAAMGSNMLFWLESGYFDTANEFKPLIHTWSLSVEAQYYLLFPLAVAGIWRMRPSWLPAGLAVTAMVSFALAVWCSQTPGWQNIGFYWLPSRLWELLLGAWVALGMTATATATPPARAALPGQGALALCGLALIATALALPDVPNIPPLVPPAAAALGAALVLANARPGTLAASLLSHRTLVWLGAISYGTYLWHQPLFALARARSYTELPSTHLVALAVLSLVLGYASTRWLERPFRRPRTVPRGAFLRAMGIGAAMVVTPGLAGYALDGLPQRYPPVLLQNLNPAKSADAVPCLTAGLDAPEVKAFGRTCAFGALDGHRTVALYGDSHVQMLMPELHRAFATIGTRGLRVELPACSTIPNIVEVNSIGRAPANNAACARAFDALIRHVQQQVDAIIIGVRWTYRLHPVPGQIDGLTFDNGEGGRETAGSRRFAAIGADGQLSFSAEAKEDAVAALIQPLLRTGKRVVLMYPSPEVGWNVPRYNMAWYRRTQEVPVTISTSFSRFQDRHRLAERLLDNLGHPPGLFRVRPADALCNTVLPGRCLAQVSRRTLYVDDDHLSDAGAALLVPAILEQLSQAPAPGATSVAIEPAAHAR